MDVGGGVEPVTFLDENHRKFRWSVRKFQYFELICTKYTRSSIL